jgi:thiamine kinase
VSVGERTGLVYERIDGAPMVDALTARPWNVLRLARDFGRLHATMHTAEVSGLADARDVVGAAIRAAAVEPTVREAALRRLSELPSGSALLHGDMHPGNVILSSSGPRVIDWIQAMRGPPAADVARTLFLMRDSGLQPSIPPRQRAVINLIRRAFASAYLRAYRRTRPIHANELRAWRLPVLVARLAEGIEHERARLDRLIAAERH